MTARDFLASGIISLALLACAYALEVYTGYTYEYTCTDEALCLEYYEVER